jgi:hypothetical protein
LEEECAMLRTENTTLRQIVSDKHNIQETQKAEVASDSYAIYVDSCRYVFVG